MRYTPQGTRHKVHAHEVHAHEVHPYEVHTHEMHAHEVHACEMLRFRSQPVAFGLSRSYQ
jgi:hypothetical protein